MPRQAKPGFALATISHRTDASHSPRLTMIETSTLVGAIRVSDIFAPVVFIICVVLVFRMMVWQRKAMERQKQSMETQRKAVEQQKEAIAKVEEELELSRTTVESQERIISLFEQIRDKSN